MSCDDRLEFRVTTAEKAAIIQYADRVGTSISSLLRKGMKSVMNQPEPVGDIESIEVVALRRRINAIGKLVEDWGRSDAEADRVKADLCQAHLDAQRLLGR